MPHADAIAAKIADVLAALGNPCTRDGSSIALTRWDLRIDFIEGKHTEENGAARIFPTIVARHRYLPRGFARELGVGMASTVREAAEGISASWMMLFFPLLKFLFEEKPHDCLVFDVPLQLPRADGAPYHLFAGPVQLMWCTGDNSHFGQTLLWDSFAAALLPQLPPGVHHIRCFTARGLDHLNGDVFVDGREWPQGSELLRRLAAQKLPVPDDAHPMCAIKQHLIVRPDDLVAGTYAALAAQVAAWQSIIAPKMSPENVPYLTSVLRALATMSRYGDEETHARDLMHAGESTESCDDLIAFAQSAAARVVIGDRLLFSPTYYRCNHRTRKAVERRYDQTPIYTAAVQAFSLLNTADLADEEVHALAYCSAEFRILLTAVEKNIPADKARISAMYHPTDQLVDGLDLDALMNAPGPTSPPTAKPALKKEKRWWQLW